MKQQLTRKTILITEKQGRMIEEIQKRNGILTMTEVLRLAISTLYDKTFKYGENPLENATVNDTTETIMAKAKVKAVSKQALKDAEELERLAPKIHVCERLLGGEVQTDEQGYKYCVFTQYTVDDDKEVKLPLRQVDPIIAQTSLFMPSKERVLKARPELKEIFKD